VRQGIKSIESAEKMQLWIINPAKTPGQTGLETLFCPGGYA
jgi:hypothetical protein